MASYLYYDDWHRGVIGGPFMAGHAGASRLLAAAARPLSGRRWPVEPSHTMPKILYVEDNEANRVLVSKVVQMHAGIELLTASSGEEGLAMVRESPPDLVLLDINLPGLSGFDVLAEIRGHEALHSLPVIAMTASASREELAHGLRAGFDDYLTKPFDVRRFLQLLDNFFEREEAPERDGD